MKLYLIAGHAQGKSEGARNLQTNETENMITREIILKVLPQIKKHIFTDICPFDLNLREKIKWINNRASDEDVLISLHLNSSSYRKETGTMCFYYGGSIKSKEMCQKFFNAYQKKIGLKNCGIIPDTSSKHGRIGVVRDTKGWSFLLEMGSINNDIEVVKHKGSQALLKGLKALLNIKEKPFTDVDESHPYFSATKWAKEKGVASGYRDGHLGVEENLKVGRFLAFLKKYDEAK